MQHDTAASCAAAADVPASTAADVADEPESSVTMPLPPGMAAAIARNYKLALEQVQEVARAAGRAQAPLLVAVSKTKPVDAIRAAMEAGCLHFGENYVAELVAKRAELGPGLRWHFIGHLQSNKAKALLKGVPDLWLVESVDSLRLATTLDKAAAAVGRGDGLADGRLNIFIQVNTSAEEQKGGCAPEEAPGLASAIARTCAHVCVCGLMTMGKADAPPRPYFDALVATRTSVAASLGVPASSLRLSMGMSGDWREATDAGADELRIGSAIFGARA